MSKYRHPFREVFGDEYINNNSPEEISTRAYKVNILDFLDKYDIKLCLVCFCKRVSFVIGI